MSKLSTLLFFLLFGLNTFFSVANAAGTAAVQNGAKSSGHLALMFEISGEDAAKKFDDFVTHKIKAIGYNLTDPHRRVNDVYKKLYGKTALDILSFLPVTNDAAVKPLLNIDPRLAGYNPFNMLIYKRVDEKHYHVGHLTPEAILDIIGISDKKVRQGYIKSFEKLDAMMYEAFGKENARYLDYKALPKKRMMTYVLEFEQPEYIDDFVDEFQESFEDTFAGKGYVIAGFHNYMDEEEETVLTPYDAFWTYALCHLKYSSTVFDNEGMQPDAGLFAPCTMYFFIPKGENKLYIGMPLLDTVRVALDIKDKIRVDFMKRLDTEIAKVLEEMGAKPMPNLNPMATHTAKKSVPAVKTSPAQASVTAKEIEIKNKKLAKFFVFEGNIEDKYNAFVEKRINRIGFKLTDPHKRVNDHYKKKYGSTILDVLSFMSVTNESVVKPLFNIDPRLAGFNPFNLLIYKKKADKVTHVGHLTPNAILDMLSITDPKVRESYTQSLEALDALIKKELGGKEEVLEAKSYAKDRMMNFAVKIDRSESLDDIIDDFQERFEEAFEKHDYIIAGYNNFKETDGKDTIPDYDAFWTYSLCHFKFSYTVFDNEGARPEAGLYAPCTMYMFIRKGDDKIIVGMPKLANWKATLGIEDKVRSDFIAKLDREIPQIMKSLGAEEIENINPLIAVVPKKGDKKASQTVVLAPKAPVKQAESVKTKVVEQKPKIPAVPVVKTEQPKPEATPKTEPKPKVSESDKAQPEEGYRIKLPTPPKPVKALKVITVGGSNITYTPRKEDTGDRGIIFSERRPPDYEAMKQAAGALEEDGKMPGMPHSGRVSTFLRGKLLSVEEAKAKLTKAGYRVLGVTPLDKKGMLTTIVFTDDDLLAMAKKKNSGFVGAMRLLVDQKDKQISITNPLYFARAYMGDAYDAKAAKKAVEKINKAFAGLQDSKEKVKFTLLPKYRFMDGMPFYKDMMEIGKAANAKTLLERVKSKKGGKLVDFILQIDSNTYLIGVKLGKRTSKFIKKTGTANAALLPYPVLIEQGVAKIMDPKYYISVNYPALKMSNFMKIATIPDAIRNECEKLFK